ncbi:MAG: 7-cyano-7-deazaguanine synthase QueC [Bdellovibrionales bacterium]|nr:7-cyano-7-deazaguanine synthase QueC [Bdellovibrionales bacterium]
MKSLDANRALVLLSGGQDSTTCLYWALSKFPKVHALCFEYGQRHRIELECARKIAERAGVELTMLSLSGLAELGGNALTGDLPVESKPGGDGLPNTFVPGRNIIFLSYAAAYAYQHNIRHLILGVCQTDYSGYPDCRDVTLKAALRSLSLGMEANFELHTPLMFLTKAETIALAKEVGGLEELAYSHTCYNGDRPPCGDCPACQLRAKGFAEAGEQDPLLNIESQK